MLPGMSDPSAKPKSFTLSDDDIVTSRPKPSPNGIGQVGHGASPDVVGGGKAGSDPDAAPAPKMPATKGPPTDPDA
jgi:hypothetical protein